MKRKIKFSYNLCLFRMLLALNNMLTRIKKGSHHSVLQPIGELQKLDILGQDSLRMVNGDR
jgi:hypothetical protein